MSLKLGDTGVGVTNLQKNLNTLGFSLEVDSVFGPKTENAVRAFQKTNGLEIDGIVGPKTQNSMTMRLVELYKEKNPKPDPVSYPGKASSELPWMAWLKEHDGEHEILGKDDNPFIMDLYQYGSYPKEHDEVPWCACCANAALIKNGYIGTKRADAISFKKCGDPTDIKYGAIVVIEHPDGNHHVTFFDHWVDESRKLMACRGGNQSNALKVSTFNVSGGKYDKVIAVRWPKKALPST